MRSEPNTLKTMGPRAATLVTTLHERNRTVFRLRDVREITGLSDVSARSFVRKLVARGVASRLRSGLYVLVPFELGKERTFAGDPLLVAREIMDGEIYYLSHGTAMALHRMTTQPRLGVTVSTPASRRAVDVLGVEVRFVQCRRTRFFGLVDHWVTKQEAVRVSDLERTIVDGVERPDLCGGIVPVAEGLQVRRQDVNVARLLGYARRLDVGAVLRRLGFLLELHGIAEGGELEGVRRRLTTTIVRLDPTLPDEGRYLRRWGLRLNVDPEEIRAAGRT